LPGDPQPTLVVLHVGITDNGTAPPARLILRNGVVSFFVAYPCARHVFLRTVQPHSCARWVRRCVPGECVSGKRARISPGILGCPRPPWPGSKQVLQTWTCCN